jgi:hypothetical protein
MKWEPSDPARWAVLNLADPDPTGAIPKDATVADVLAWALVLPGSDDVVNGIVDAVRLELSALADVLPDRRAADVLRVLGKRLNAAMLLLKWTDNRAKMPLEPGENEEHGEEIAPGAATDPPPPAFDPEITVDAPPSDRRTS